MPVAVPHLALPFRMGPVNGAAVVAQGSIEDVSTCVAVLISTEVGSRAPLPTYGVPDQDFASPVDTAAIVAAIATWEPRANISIAAGMGPTVGVVLNVSVAGAPPGATVGIAVLPTGMPASQVATPAPFVLTAGVIYDGGSALGGGPFTLDGNLGTLTADGGAPTGPAPAITWGATYDGGSASVVGAPFLDGQASGTDIDGGSSS